MTVHIFILQSKYQTKQCQQLQNLSNCYGCEWFKALHWINSANYWKLYDYQAKKTFRDWYFYLKVITITEKLQLLESVYILSNNFKEIHHNYNIK